MNDVSYVSILPIWATSTPCILPDKELATEGPVMNGLATPDPRDILRSKTRTEKPKDRTAQLRRYVEEIEAARQQGFSYVDIAEWLKVTDIQVTGKQLSEIMCRLRKSGYPLSSTVVASLSDRQESVLDAAKKKLATGNKTLWERERGDK